jgi:NADH:ubiquinone oxidoreductase subunit E
MANVIKLERDPEIRAELQQLIAKYGNDRSALAPILHDLQKKYRGIPDDHMQILADLLNMHAVEVQEVITFYHFYNTGTKGKYIIRMCKTMPCKMAGAGEVAKQLEKKLGIKFGATTPDNKFTLEWTSCIGMCDQGPAFLINDKPYTKVKAEAVSNILQQCQ